jgi:hypothetical protein
VEGVTRAAEKSLAFTLSPLPAAALDAKGWNRNSTRLSWNDKINCDGAILSSSFEDVAGLNKDIEDVRKIFYSKFSHIARLVNDHMLFFHRVMERNVVAAVYVIGVMEEKNREILMCVRSGNIKWRFVHV